MAKTQYENMTPVQLAHAFHRVDSQIRELREEKRKIAVHVDRHIMEDDARGKLGTDPTRAEANAMVRVGLQTLGVKPKVIRDIFGEVDGDGSADVSDVQEGGE